MRIVLAIVAVTACADFEPSTPETRLSWYSANVEIYCGGVAWGTCPESPRPERALECMNVGLASGQIAVLTYETRDTHFFRGERKLFTIDHELKIFESNENGTSETTCANPTLRLQDYVCPFGSP